MPQMLMVQRPPESVRTLVTKSIKVSAGKLTIQLMTHYSERTLVLRPWHLRKVMLLMMLVYIK